MQQASIHCFSKTILAAAAAVFVTACGGSESGGGNGNPNTKPANIGVVTIKAYDGGTDDLLTAGLGKAGLASATAPLPADPNAPTAAELRRYAIYTNYRAIADTTAGGGFGTFYGPNVDAQGNVTAGRARSPASSIWPCRTTAAGRRT